jgi:RNA processing factor Prp31
MTDNQHSKPNETDATGVWTETIEYLVGAYFDMLQGLVNRNRAYYSVLTELVSREEIPVYLKNAEAALPSVI